MEVNLYETFANYYLAIGIFCLTSVYFPIASFLTLIFYIWMTFDGADITYMLNFVFSNPFQRHEFGMNNMMKFIKSFKFVRYPLIEDRLNPHFQFVLWFIWKGYFNFWDPVKEEYLIFDRDDNGRTIFYYIDNSHFTAEEKKEIKEEIVYYFKKHLGHHFEPYRIERKRVKQITKLAKPLLKEVHRLDREASRLAAKVVKEERDNFFKNIPCMVVLDK